MRPSSLYLRVLVGIGIGISLGLFIPDFAIQLKFLSDIFIGLVKMLIAPVIFCTVVTGIARTGSMKKVGIVGVKSIVYFEVVSTLALTIGLIVANVLHPGSGFHADPNSLDAEAVRAFASAPHDLNFTDFVLHIIPSTFVDAFTNSGNLLQVLLVALLFGYAMTHLGESAQFISNGIHTMSQIFFKMVNVVMQLAPLGAGGAMAFTIGKYGIHSLQPMLFLMFCFYLTCVIFISLVLGAVAFGCGFNIFRFVYYIRDELVTVLGTSSSESVLAPLIEKMERLGCSKSVVGLVVPTGYSFNLDGTNIYLTMAALFIAQALDIQLSLGQQLSLLAVAIVSSKGASGVTGAGFITLAATLSVVPDIPVAGMALILGVDRFMSEARALTNTVGNGLAAVVISKWENELDTEKLKRELSGRAPGPSQTSGVS